MTLIVGLLLALQAQALGPPVRVTGTVVDSTTGAVVSGAVLRAAIAGNRVVTNRSGEFSLAAGPVDTLTIQALGYRWIRMVVALASGPLRIVLSPAPELISDLVVTASRRVERAEASAVQVATISAAEIAAAGAASADRALERLPGLQVLPNAPTGSNLSIRGVNGARVLVLIDGEPVPGSLLENRDLSRLSTVAIERIEVVKGPLSALYGSDALGGVVNLITQSPRGPLTATAEARAGDFGRRELRLGAAAGGAVAFRVDGGAREHQEVASIDPAPGALSRVWDLRSTVRWAATGSLAFRGDLSLFRERQRWQVSSDGFNGFNDNRGVTGWLESTWIGERSSLRGRVVFEDYTHRFRQARATQPLGTDSAPAQSERVTRGNLGWSRRLGGHSFDLGIDASHRAIESPGKLNATAADDLVEGYIQDGWTRAKFLIQPAARLSWNSRWGTAVTPSLALAWDRSSSLRLRLSGGRGFRGPSFKELAWDFPNPLAGYTLRGNPDLRPERSWQTALGGSWTIDRNLVVDAEVYRNDIRDLIELVEAGTDPGSGLRLFTTRNVNRTRTEGADLLLRWSGRGWETSAGYGILSAVDRSTGAALERRAKHQAKVRAGRGFGPRFDGGLSLVVTGAAPVTLPDGTGARQEPYAAAAVYLRFEVTPGTTLSTGIDNLFDAKPGNWVGVIGRRVYFGVSTRLTP